MKDQDKAERAVMPSYQAPQLGPDGWVNDFILRLDQTCLHRSSPLVITSPATSVPFIYRPKPQPTVGGEDITHRLAETRMKQAETLYSTELVKANAKIAELETSQLDLRVQLEKASRVQAESYAIITHLSAYATLLDRDLQMCRGLITKSVQGE